MLHEIGESDLDQIQDRRTPCGDQRQFSFPTVQKLDGLAFVETEACRGGCFGGSLTVENSYSAKANIKPLIDEAKEKYGERTLNLPGEEDELLRNRPLCYRPVLRLD